MRIKITGDYTGDQIAALINNLSDAREARAFAFTGSVTKHGHAVFSAAKASLKARK